MAGVRSIKPFDRVREHFCLFKYIDFSLTDSGGGRLAYP
jgi:hypothetical protein